MTSSTEPDTGTETAENERLSFSDLVASLDGFEENDIEERFGEPIGDLMNRALSKAGRALLFIDGKRRGEKPVDAYKTAMKMRLVDVNDRFFDRDTDDTDLDDADPDNPETERGKDDASSD